MQRLAFFNGQLRYLGLAHRLNAQFAHAGVEALRQQGVKVQIVVIHEGTTTGRNAAGLTTPLEWTGPILSIADQLQDTTIDAMVVGHTHRISNLQYGKFPIVEGINAGTSFSVLQMLVRDGDVACYPLAENEHAGGILSVTRAPFVDARLQRAAERNHRRLFRALGYVGVLCVEYFVERGRLVANEMAPRVHNSGHWSIEGAETSQFENHVRAVAGLPLGSTALRGHAAMVNVIGRKPGAGDRSDGAAAAVERELARSAFVSHAAVLSGGPAVRAIVSIDPDTVGDWARRQGYRYTSMQSLASHEGVVSLVTSEVLQVIRRHFADDASAEVRILPDQLRREDGSLTPTGTLRRRALLDAFDNAGLASQREMSDALPG